ncbi:hypothetical protein NPIL_192501, partial [Nephila pilipes]
MPKQQKDCYENSFMLSPEGICQELERKTYILRFRDSSVNWRA